MARVALDGFTGSLPELLAAAVGGQLDAAALSLEAVLSQILAQDLDLEQAVTAFVTVAQLVDLKARLLLPVPPPAEEPTEAVTAEEEAAALAERLATYQAFAQAAEALRAFERRRGRQFGRPASGGPGNVAGSRAAPPEGALEPHGDLERLLAVFAEVWERARPRTREVARERFTVTAAAAALRRRLAEARVLEFGDLFAEDADRLQVVVTFLALLEMVRQGEVSVGQEGPFAPLRIVWTGAVRRTPQEVNPDAR